MMDFATYRYQRNAEHPGILPTHVQAKSIALALYQTFQQSLKECQIQPLHASDLRSGIQKAIRKKDQAFNISVRVRNQTYRALIKVQAQETSYSASLSPIVTGTPELDLYPRVLVKPLSTEQLIQLSKQYQTALLLKTLIHAALTHANMDPDTFNALTQYYLKTST